MLKRFSVVLLCVFGACSAAKWPGDIERCKFEDIECMMRKANEIIKSSPDGRPDLGIPQTDPFHINKLVINQGETGPLQLDLSFDNVDISGLSDLVVKNITGFAKDPSTSKFEFVAISPKVILKGHYSTNGRILILPIQGDGDAHLVFDNLEFSVKFKPKVTTKNGKSKLSVDKLKLFLTPAKVTTELTNLFNGDKALGDNMNQFLNENWKDVWTELSEPIFEAIGEVVKNIINGFFAKFTYENLFVE